MKTCDECKFCLLEDYGYSNYTVEGTYVHCLKRKHPESGFDQFFGEDERLRFAEKCESFTKGDPVFLDCDREDQKKYDDPLSASYTSDPEVAPLLDAWQSA